MNKWNFPFNIIIFVDPATVETKPQISRDSYNVQPLKELSETA